MGSHAEGLKTVLVAIVMMAFSCRGFVNGCEWLVLILLSMNKMMHLCFFYISSMQSRNEIHMLYCEIKRYCTIVPWCLKANAYIFC